LKVTLPLELLTVTVKLAGLPPVTVWDEGDTRIWPLLLEVAVTIWLPE